MAGEETAGAAGSGKNTRKGGKRGKALTAEEEARRREEVKEKLREKLELEKRALQVVERLLEDSVAEDFLLDCAKFITPANYKDVIEERCIAKLCGYPICPSKLGKIPTQQFKISTKSNKVYDITERKCFCSNFCYKASKEFELQISQTPLWLRQHESPPKITLRKKGDSGSSGEEVILTHRRLYEKDIEDPLASLTEGRSQQRPAAADPSHSDGSDAEQEQDFVSSVVPGRQGPRVHWGDLPKRTDVDKNGKPDKRKRREKPRSEEDKAEVESHLGEEGKAREDENRQEEKIDAEEQKRLSLRTNKHIAEQEGGVCEGSSVDEAAARLNACTLSETVTPPLSVDPTQDEPSAPPAPTDSNPSTESKQLPDVASPNAAQTRLNITQVGLSKRGAAGLRQLLKNQAAVQPGALRLNLLESLKRTLRDWSTDATLRFLYGAVPSPGSALTGLEDAEEEEEEELDEDDLDDEVTAEDAEAAETGPRKKASAAAPDYEKLQEESRKMELRVREFYKGTWILPEEEDEVTAQAQSRKNPVLPPVDSNAQHLIQKRITVDKLSSCLRNIVGPLRLTMNDISTDLNNLVRTFRFTSTNIIHKTPEWTLIAVALLHLLSEVSPLVRDALEAPASVEYLNTLTKELGLQEQDLLNVARLFKGPAH